MAPRITGSANREKRKAQSSNRPITQGQNPQRSNRQGVSRATVSNGDSRTRTGTARVTSGQVPPKPVTRQSRVNGRLKPGTDTRPSPNTRATANTPSKPTGPTPYQVSDPWAKPVRPSIGNVSGPASSPNRPAATPKPPTNPAGNFKAPSVPAAGSATKPPVKGTPQAEAWLKEQLKVRGSNALKGSTIGNLKTGVAGAAVQALSDQFLAPQVRRLGTALGKGPLTALGRFIDDRLPGINSKDEARRKDPTKTVVDSRTPRLANSMPSRPVGTRATLNSKSVYWDGYKWTPSSGSPVTASKPNTPKAPKPPAATNTASRSSASSRSSDGSSMSSPVRTSSPKPAAPKKSAPAKPGQKFADFNPGRGTSKTNNPLMKDMVGRMKDREDKAQASAASKLTNRFNTKDSFSGEKVDGSTVNTKAKINSTTSEYDKKKRRYGG